MARANTVLVQGRIGVVDAALIRWLKLTRVNADFLAVHITQSVYDPILSKDHLKEFFSALEMVDMVLLQNGEVKACSQPAESFHELRTVTLPEDDLFDYSMKRICKRQPVVENEYQSKKLTTLDALCKYYGPRPPRQVAVGMVSGVFDLLHPGHVSMIKTAKTRVNQLIVLTMGSSAIKQLGKNHFGDRPIYNNGDRVEVLTALRYVDHVVVFNDVNCLGSIKAFCPDYFFKNVEDRSRPVVQAEADLVNQLGGQSVYLEDCPREYSSTQIIEYIREHTGFGHG